MVQDACSVVKAQNDARRCSIDMFLCPIAIALASSNAYLKDGKRIDKC
jgi:hypothetical protein